MFKTIKISALVSSILLIGGMLFKNQHLMGANVIFMAGVAAGVFAVLLTIPFLAGKGTSRLERVTLIFASATIALALLGFLFKVLHWPGAAKLIWVADLGIVVSGILFLIDGMMEKDPARSVLKIVAMFFLLLLLMLILVTS